MTGVQTCALPIFGERQVLGVGLPGFQFQALDLGAAGGGFQERGHEVGGGYAGSPAGGG